jgi:hypothetical protein
MYMQPVAGRDGLGSEAIIVCSSKTGRDIISSKGSIR